MLAPKGFTQHSDKTAYVKAQMVVHKRIGILRFSWPMRVLAAAFAVYGGNLLLTSAGRGGYILTGLVLVLMAITAVALWELVLTARLKTDAENAFISYEAITNHAVVTFGSDDMTLQTAVMTRRVEYAKTHVCIELPERFVLVTDDRTIVLLEKNDFTDREATELFLRDVYARWYCRMR